MPLTTYGQDGPGDVLGLGVLQLVHAQVAGVGLVDVELLDELLGHRQPVARAHQQQEVRPLVVRGGHHVLALLRDGDVSPVGAAVDPP